MIVSLQSRRNFRERMLSIFLKKIMAAIFDFNGSGKMGRVFSVSNFPIVSLPNGKCTVQNLPLNPGQ